MLLYLTETRPGLVVICLKIIAQLVTCSPEVMFQPLSDSASANHLYPPSALQPPCPPAAQRLLSHWQMSLDGFRCLCPSRARDGGYGALGWAVSGAGTGARRGAA
jgi:hypothetical protein